MKSDPKAALVVSLIKYAIEPLGKHQLLKYSIVEVITFDLGNAWAEMYLLKTSSERKSEQKHVYMAA